MFNVINEMGALLWSQLIQKKKVNTKIREKWRLKICELHKHFTDEFSITDLGIC